MNWQTPYSIKRHAPIFFWPFYYIMFDETAIAVFTDYDLARQVLGCLNGAYNLGYLAGCVESIDKG